MKTVYVVRTTASSRDLSAAADYINRHAEAGGYTHDRRAIEAEIESCHPLIREALVIEACDDTQTEEDI